MTKQGTEYKGCKVYAPHELLGQYNENILVIIASSAYIAMKKQLNEMGYIDRQIYRLKNFELENMKSFSYEKGYNYYNMSLKEIQMESFEILKFIKKQCDSKNIRYFLGEGTLLGAVRHKGFLPWDDDIDIYMPYKDYIRFCDEFEENEDYELYSIFGNNKNQPKCWNLFTKVMSKNTVSEQIFFPLHCRSGISVDIFPLNGYPDDKYERELYEKELKEAYLLWVRNVVKNIKDSEVDDNIYNNSSAILKEVMTRYDYDKSNWVGNVVCAEFKHTMGLKEKYELPSKLLFEGEYFDAPNDAEYILKQLYGNYMEFPPESERKARHFFNVHRLEKI